MKKKVINFKPRRHHKGEDIRYTRTGRRVCTTRHKKEKGTSYEEEQDEGYIEEDTKKGHERKKNSSEPTLPHD